jgi:hypothetical protein
LRINQTAGRTRSNCYLDNIQLYYEDFWAPKGDVNGDGEVNIADVNAVIDVILAGGNEYTATLADVNGDGEVNIADVNALIDLIIN